MLQSFGARSDILILRQPVFDRSDSAVGYGVPPEQISTIYSDAVKWTPNAAKAA